MQDPCILIPSYNEADTIGGIVKTLKDRGLTVYVVDDGSADDTASEAASNGAIVIRHQANKGKGAALKTGFARALSDGFGSILIMDGDDQHDAGDIDNFVKKMESSGADMVIGNRMSDTLNMPRLRINVNKLMSYIISKICGQYIPDTQCGFRLIKAGLLRSIELESSNYDTESELIIKAAKKGFKIASVPVKTVYRNETSKIRPVRDTLRFIVLLLRNMSKQ